MQPQRSISVTPTPSKANLASRRKSTTPTPSKANLASRRKSTTPSYEDVSEYWMCWLCDEPQVSAEKLEKHRIKEHKEPCGHCLMSFTTKSDLLKHQFLVHGNKKQRSGCPECKEPFDQNSWEGHRKTGHHNHSCPDCNLRFTSELLLWSHRVLKHSGTLQNERPSSDVGGFEEDAVALT